jgi:hypothetical protein
MYQGTSYRLNNGAIERNQNGVITSSPNYNAIAALIKFDAEDSMLNLWFKNPTETALIEQIDLVDLLVQSPAFGYQNYEAYAATSGSGYDESAIILGNQVVLSTADPIDGEQVPGMVESVRFNAGTLEYGVAGTWTIVPGATGLERSLLADDGTIFNKSQDGVTYTKVVPGEWLMLPTDGGMFANVASDPGSVLLGVYDSSVTPTPPSGGSGSGGGSNPPIVGYEALTGDRWVPFGDGYRYARFKNGVIDVSWIESPSSPPNANAAREFGFFRDTPGGELTGILNGFILSEFCYVSMPGGLYFKAQANGWTAISIPESEYLQALANPLKLNF